MLTIAILQYIESMGDVAAIQDVEQLARQSANVEDGNRLHEQAIQCLATLRKLQAAEKQGAALLRSCDSPKQAAELLREARLPEAKPEELLRPEDKSDGSL
jgi:hypothetical protein